MRLLEANLEAAAQGSGRVVLLSGAAGIGKSDLARRVIAEAATRGFLTLQGRAHPLYGGLAYGPIVEALSPHIGAEDGQADPGWLAGLSGADQLTRLFLGVSGPPPIPLGDPALERIRLFEAVSRLIARMSRQSPVVLWLDDLDWADDLTIELTHYLCLAVGPRRMLILLTWPGSPIDGALADLVVSLRRFDGCAELHLNPLSAAEVNELIRHLLGADPPQGLLDAVLDRSGGIPLFASAMVAELIASGRLIRGQLGWAVATGSQTVLPSIVRDVVISKLERTGAEERRLFELIAVAAGSATSDVLSTVLGDGWELPLRALLVDGLVLERQARRTELYQAAHPLYAEVANANLTGSERRRAHAQVAAAVNALRPWDVAALAPHVAGAGDLVDPRWSLGVLTDAGHRALTLHATVQAVGYLGDAVARANELGRQDLLPALKEALGNALEGAGDLAGAAREWRGALEIATVDTSTTASLHNRLALLEWERGNLDLSESHLQHVDSVPGDADGLVMQHLVRLILIGRSGNQQVSVAAVEGLEKLARRYPSRSAEAAVHLARSLLAMLQRDYAVCRAEGQRALELLDSSDTLFNFGGPHRQISVAALAVGDLDIAAAHAALGVQAAHQHGIPSIECSLRVNLAIIHFLAADWDAAQSQLETAVALGRRSLSSRSLAVALVWRGFLQAHRGAGEAARRSLVEAARAYPPGADQHYSGDYGVVRATIEEAAGRPVPDLQVEPPVTGARFALALPLLGQARLAAGDMAGAISVIEQLRDVTGSPPLPNAFADRLQGLLNRDEPMMQAAMRSFDALAMPFEMARVALERCEFAVDIDEALAAVEVFDRIGAKPWSDRARRLLRTVGVRTAPPPRARGVLSPREDEVARLAADGLSNAQIASRLYLSVRTVETHLGKVYARLGLGSRVALTRWIGQHPDT
jgi:DNA-binding CsgD family transcriptional regulator